jgi:hypothetical protein
MYTWHGIKLSKTIALVFLVSAVAALVAPVLWSTITTGKPFPDYAVHISDGSRLFRGETHTKDSLIYQGAHVLFPFMVGLVALLPTIGPYAAGLLVATGAYILLAIILYFLFHPVVQAKNALRSETLCVSAVLVVMFMAPINLPSFGSKGFYYGYIHPTVYHNPTTTLLRPFAILLMLYAIKCFSMNHRAKWDVPPASVITLLATFAKPSFTLSLLPALGLSGVYYFFKDRERVNWRLLGLGICLPSLLFLVVQYELTYGAYAEVDPDVGVIFAPLVVMEEWSHHWFMKLMLSIMFPLAVYLLYLGSSSKSVGLNLAWLAFLAGASQMYLFAESGYRMLHGNFLWSGYITLFVLNVFSLRFLLNRLQQKDECTEWRTIVVAMILTTHVVSGVVWYLANLPGSSVGPWWNWGGGVI